MGAILSSGLLASCNHLESNDTASSLPVTPILKATPLHTVVMEGADFSPPTVSPSPPIRSMITSTTSPEITSQTSDLAPRPPEKIIVPLPSAQLKGMVAGGGRNRYLLENIKAGQRLKVTLSELSPNEGAILAIYGSDGIPIVLEESDTTYWEGQLPTTQDYMIEVWSVSTTPTNYLLEIEIFS